ncbi:GNAT family N-acetyltransferase [Streptomyces sp. NPDC016845]|uniref:GNAT family N-acetyltransferase n=1 Tax=Streptomyces sp. NPDC016845 TaxID=3364972 RepID=UPI00378C23E6
MRETNDSAPQVRVRSAEDLPGCVAVLRAVHEQDRYPVRWPPDPERWLAHDADDTGWVAQLDGRIVGHVLLVRPDGGDVAPGLLAPDTPVAVVSRLFVDPAARGRRIGALLLDRAAREAQSRGARAVLDVVTSDRAAIALYERLGWEFLAAGQQEWGPGELVDVRCYTAPPVPTLKEVR